MKHTLVKLVATGALVFAAQLSVAQPADDLEALHESGRFMAHLSEQLGLSEDQLGDIEEIFSQSHEMYADEREQLEALKDEMRVLVEEDFDEGAAQAISDDIGRLSGVLAFGHALTQAQVRSVLTDEQLATLVELQQLRMDRRELMREFHRGGYRDAPVRRQRREF